MHWLTLGWYRYLWSSRDWGNLWCRIKGHPNGVWWFTGPEAMEPDMHCKDCGEDLG